MAKVSATESGRASERERESEREEREGLRKIIKYRERERGATYLGRRGR